MGKTVSKRSFSVLYPVKRVSGEPRGPRETTHVELDVIHSKERKAVSVGVTPVALKDEGGWTSKSFMLFSGKRARLEPMPRLNAKRLDALLEEAKAEVASKVGPAWLLMAALLEENGLELEAS